MVSSTPIWPPTATTFTTSCFLQSRANSFQVHYGADKLLLFPSARSSRELLCVAVINEIAKEFAFRLWHDCEHVRLCGAELLVYLNDTVIFSSSPSQILYTDAQMAHLVDQFWIDQTQTSLSLPPVLDARQRKFVHERAQNLGMKSQSQGEGEARHIVLNKVK